MSDETAIGVADLPVLRLINTVLCHRFAVAGATVLFAFAAGLSALLSQVRYSASASFTPQSRGVGLTRFRRHGVYAAAFNSCWCSYATGLR